MDSSQIRFIVIDLRCYLVSSYPLAEEYFHEMKLSLQEYFNTLVKIHSTNIFSIILVKHCKVEVWFLKYFFFFLISHLPLHLGIIKAK